MTPEQQQALLIARESIADQDTGHLGDNAHYWANRYRDDLERILRVFTEEGKS